MVQCRHRPGAGSLDAMVAGVRQDSQILTSDLHLCAKAHAHLSHTDTMALNKIKSLEKML